MQKIDLKTIFLPRNRGILLDLVVFFLNLISMTVLTRRLANLLHEANADRTAQVGITVFCFALVFLQPVGAILKRRGAHQRHPDLDLPAGCLIMGFYFLSQLLFLIIASSMIVEMVSGNESSPHTANYFGLPPGLFTALFLGVPALAIANTLIVYFYFHQPKHEPFWAFLTTPQAERLGDTFLFFNMICFQMMWSYLVAEIPKDYSGIGDRLFTFGFTALLIYIPPRLFYLAEDGHRPLTWLTMLLANSPIILRLLLAASAKPVPDHF